MKTLESLTRHALVLSLAAMPLGCKAPAPRRAVGVISQPPALSRDINPADGTHADKFSAFIDTFDGEQYHFTRYQSAKEYFEAYTQGDSIVLTFESVRACPDRAGCKDVVYATLERYFSTAGKPQ